MLEKELREDSLNCQEGTPGNKDGPLSEKRELVKTQADGNLRVGICQNVVNTSEEKFMPITQSAMTKYSQTNG